MRTRPKDIARALIDEVASGALTIDDACDNALALLRKLCPSTSRREFVKLVEREIKTRGQLTDGLLIVPNHGSISSEAISSALTQKSGKPIQVERKTNPDLIGGAVLLVDHRRIDCSIQGALKELLRTCLEPLH